MRRVRMVQAVAAGQSITDVARNEECSRAWVTRELDSRECHHFLTELMNYDRARVYRLFQQTLTSIAEAFKAEKQVLVEGKWVTRADHSTRLTAAKRFMELSSIGRAMPQRFEAKAPLLTLQQLEEIVARPYKREKAKPNVDRSIRYAPPQNNPPVD